jgi:cell division septation protein DedD
VTGTPETTPPPVAQEQPPPPPRQPEQGQPKAPAVQGQFALQVGAYSTQVNADKQKLFFEDLGYPVEVISKTKDGRTLFTVNIGNYATYDEAKAKSAALKKQYNLDSFVVTR